MGGVRLIYFNDPKIRSAFPSKVNMLVGITITTMFTGMLTNLLKFNDKQSGYMNPLFLSVSFAGNYYPIHK